MAAAVAAGSAHAAEIKLAGKNADGVPVVSVKGGFIARDIERFADVTKDLPDAIISFSSNGGNLATGIEIGTRIRLRGYRTVVADQVGCYSACAVAWLGGTTRYVGRGAQVGFHAAYFDQGGRLQETGVGNAVVGGYAANLGLSTAAIMFLTSAPPEGFNYLTEDVVRRVGISAEFVDTEKLALIPVIIRPSTEELVQRGVRYYQNNEYAEAVRWYRLAAEQGYAKAQHKIGSMYFNGHDVGQDHAEAVRWFRMAAEQGHATAQKNLDPLLQVRRRPAG